ncbi:FG-GAP repeat domain-containing protein [Dokdonella sp.]|uniref:FG-GAP repeat domain-containing protein n=1 Tax=Dokdonella sp. TaxID=2291710 RepID=UPI003C3BA43E
MSIRFNPSPFNPAASLLLAALASANPALAGDWVTFTEATSTRLVTSDPNVGANDIREKDLATGDLDQDGDTDLVVVRKIPFTNPGGFRNVLFMNEKGVMTDRTEEFAEDFLDDTDDRDVELVDVNGDGWLDIVTAGTFNQQPRILINLARVGGVWQGFAYQPARLPVLLSGTGSGPKFCGLGVGDLTGDGRPELYFTDYANDLEDKLLINDGNGFFSDETATRLTTAMTNSTFGTDADIADMNGDGFKDIIKNNATGTETPGPNSPSVMILYNDGTGHFEMFDTVNADAPYMVAVADFTQDDRLDLFVVDDSQDHYLINTGNDGQGHAQFATSSSAPSPNTTFFGGNTDFADLDADGTLDVFVADVDTDVPGCDGQLVIMKGQGTPPAVTYFDPLAGGSRPWTPQGTQDVAAFHIDNDGKLDLWIATCTGNRIFMSDNPDFIFADGFDES